VVVRCSGGAVDKFTGDGIMALFGAPVALEDHALPDCLAALAIQDEVQRLAVEVLRRNHIALRLRVGLSSGRVVALGHGCGAHSEAQLRKKQLPQPVPDPSFDTISRDDLEEF